MQFKPPYEITALCRPLLHSDHINDLRRSGLNDETIAQAGVYSLAPRFIDGFFQRAPATVETALCFPYQGGKFARIKLFPQLGKMKYAQPIGTSARLYVPFPVRDETLFIAEGEKKTLAGYQAGLNIVGIGGLWNWLSKGKAIDDLRQIDWDRDVVIIPDSDVFQRANLLRAVYAFGVELRAAGAAVTVAQLPQPNNSKVGLDDFLVAGGKTHDLDVFGLGHRVFKSAAYWHGRWKFKKALAA
jgi:Domain of unknown function (DUF3854)